FGAEVDKAADPPGLGSTEVLAHNAPRRQDDRELFVRLLRARAVGDRVEVGPAVGGVEAPRPETRPVGAGGRPPWSNHAFEHPPRRWAADLGAGPAPPPLVRHALVRDAVVVGRPTAGGHAELVEYVLARLEVVEITAAAEPPCQLEKDGRVRPGAPRRID